MRMRLEKEHHGYLLRIWNNKWTEVAYAFIGIRGLRAEIEFPSDWHEHRRAWVRLGFGLFSINFSFPWQTVVPDQGQCEGPSYGFYFFEDHLVLQWGKSTGRSGCKAKKFIDMPWAWRGCQHVIHTEPETHPYTYTLRSGEVQQRKATIYVESRRWTRPWLPAVKFVRAINIDFDAEVGERTGSWKGGVLGCGYHMLPGETPVDCLRRMERDQKFT